MFLVLSITPVFGQVTSASLVNNEIEYDQRIYALTFFLQSKNSPLVSYAEEFLKAADYYEIDWKLVPAITGIESSFGKHMPQNTYNAYGWNGGNYYFDSWKASIWHVTKVLKTKYYDHGAKSISQIAKIYAPPSVVWARSVSHFSAEIEQTSNFVFSL